MKISYRWLYDYLQSELDPQALSEILTDIGLEVESLSPIQPIKGGLEGIVTGQVLTCHRHPNADRLSVTTVNIGTSTPLNIVCGAPNVQAGQKVLVATVGTTLYPTQGEPFTIKKAKVRGEESNGMICAEDEIGLGHSHEGILVLPPDTPVGLPAAQALGLQTDYLIEIGLTPNRADAFSHYGVAADVAARLRAEGQPVSLCQPDVSSWYEQPAPANPLPIDVNVADPTLCPRYCGVCIADLRVGPSPDWLQQRLHTIGIRSINNIVDITNYVLHELGQPLHAFDYDHIAGASLHIKTLPAGTTFVGLDGTSRQLHPDDLMITDAQQQPLCMAGVFGGQHSGVTEQTTRIFLESAHFQARSVRKSAARHLWRTDAAQHFEKGTDPNIALFALQRAALLIAQLAGGHIASKVIDLYPTPITPKAIPVKWSYLQRITGDPELTPQRITHLIAALGMHCTQSDAHGTIVHVPTNKPDVTRPADLAEEILRIHGLNRVPFPDTMPIALSAAEQQTDPWALQHAVAQLLTAQGCYEIMSLSLVPATSLPDSDRWVRVHNTANQNLDLVRPSLLHGGLQALSHNLNRQQHHLRLFEFGSVFEYQPNTNQYLQHQQLGIWLTGRRQPENWLNTGPDNTTFYTLKALVEQILHRLGIRQYQQDTTAGTPPTPDNPWLYALHIHRGPTPIATLGQVHPHLLRQHNIKQDTYFSHIYWDTLLSIASSHRIQFSEPSKYPAVRRDLALLVPKSTTFAQLEATARKTEKQLIEHITLFDVFEDPERTGPNHKSYALQFVFRDTRQTLSDTTVEQVIQQLIAAFERIGATVRK